MYQTAGRKAVHRESSSPTQSNVSQSILKHLATRPVEHLTVLMGPTATGDTVH
ncbi:predicted protein [Plenodomus lingam JN3]|uniref:Uncharacterized protein n=1 Tax=Leptosphaeria maculans (strain JN3 / isolate v23.1.3 / race Av1-4-5-6-7-8) TaxID=985895 RepID=E5A756_LEPMJ|nr:predicted protein [Plenodomus lingam JN3]CBX99451.1 predicted protein [Plenodomus lingam JN3]